MSSHSIAFANVVSCYFVIPDINLFYFLAVFSGKKNRTKIKGKQKEMKTLCTCFMTSNIAVAAYAWLCFSVLGRL